MASGTRLATLADAVTILYARVEHLAVSPADYENSHREKARQVA